MRSPTPSSPQRPSPHAQGAPRLVTIIVKFGPHAANSAGSCCCDGITTSFGNSKFGYVRIRFVATTVIFETVPSLPLTTSAPGIDIPSQRHSDRVTRSATKRDDPMLTKRTHLNPTYTRIFHSPCRAKTELSTPPYECMQTYIQLDCAPDPCVQMDPLSSTASE